MRELYARRSEKKLQSLKDHLRNVAFMASNFSIFPNISKLSGLLHDLGKVSSAFQEYLLDGNGKRGSVIHAFHGVHYSKGLGKNEVFDAVLKQLLSLIISSHHNSLPDCIECDGSGCHADKFSEDNGRSLSLDEMFQWLDTNPDIVEESHDAYTNALTETEAFLNRIRSVYLPLGKSSANFAIGLFAKYLYSCLIDADRTDAFFFETGERTENGIESQKQRQQLWHSLSDKLEKELTSIPSMGKVPEVRSQISLSCKNAAPCRTAIYQLSVPTGGGKTLSSLRFALEHAKIYGKRRIIYVIPFLSIINQTAGIFRDFLIKEGDDPTDIILEHHSDFVSPESENERSEREFACSRWDKPIVITTMVNFLETIMSAGGGNLRKFHNMQNSVIIFDEIQSIPPNSIHVFNENINFLSSILGSTILLCTATQPRIHATERKNLMLSDHPALIKLNDAELSVFKRTKLDVFYNGMSLEEFTLFAGKKASEMPSTLIILNTKKTAQAVFNKLSQQGEMGRVFYLSADMCPAHRSDVLSEMKSSLLKQRTTLVSTQVIEAGVDVSFTCVIRATAGLDSIVQAAGRCNRNGENTSPLSVYVVSIKDENITRLKHIKTGKECSERVFRENRGADFLTQEILDKYYEYYYNAIKGQMDYVIDAGNTAYSMLSSNDYLRSCYKNTKGKAYDFPLAQSFKTVSNNYYVIEKNTQKVIVYYRNSENLIAKYRNLSFIGDRVEMVKRLDRYSITMYSGKSFDQMESTGLIQTLDEELGIKILSSQCYDQISGLKPQGGDDFIGI